MLFSIQSLLPAILLLTPILAIPVDIETRQTVTKCGSVSYTVAETSACKNAAFSYYQSSTKAGSSTYPHTFNNREGFSFDVVGPYQEFPLKKGGAYTGGAPGADRCVISNKNGWGGAITHTGASGNNFVACSGTTL